MGEPSGDSNPPAIDLSQLMPPPTLKPQSKLQIHERNKCYIILSH